jgi:hypothetical protein
VLFSYRSYSSDQHNCDSIFGLYDGNSVASYKILMTLTTRRPPGTDVVTIITVIIKKREAMSDKIRRFF